MSCNFTKFDFNVEGGGGGGGEMSKDFSGETEYGKHVSETSSDKPDRIAEEHQRDSYMRHIIMLILGLITLMIAIMVCLVIMLILGLITLMIAIMISKVIVI